MIDKLKLIFIEIGLGEDEAEVYLINLKLGPATVLQISKKTNIIRATLYKILSRLESKNLVSQIEKDGRTYFVAEDPQMVIERLKDEEIRKHKALETANNILDDLNQITKKMDHPKVGLFEGQKAIAELFLMPTQTPGVKEILIMIDFDSLFSYMPEKSGIRFRDQRLEKGITLKILRRHNTKAFRVPEHDEEEMREKRFLNDNFNLEAGFIIFGNKVAIITTPGEPFGILIESKYFSDTMHSVFNHLWDSALRN